MKFEVRFHIDNAAQFAGEAPHADGYETWEEIVEASSKDEAIFLVMDAMVEAARMNSEDDAEADDDRVIVTKDDEVVMCYYNFEALAADEETRQILALMDAGHTLKVAKEIINDGSSIIEVNEFLLGAYENEYDDPEEYERVLDEVKRRSINGDKEYGMADGIEYVIFRCL